MSIKINNLNNIEMEQLLVLDDPGRNVFKNIIKVYIYVYIPNNLFQFLNLGPTLK